jgi:protoporphyrinogen oxidase
VIGAGVLGLTVARKLADRGHEVVLYEAAPEVGGLASAWDLGDVRWDRHYHVTLLSDARTRAMLRDLGLEDDMRWVETKTGVYADGSLHSVSNSIEYLRFPALTLVDKVRLAATILAGSRMKNWRKLEQEPVDEWLIRWSGQRTFDRWWLPLLRAKLGDGYHQASAAFLWATIQRLYAARRSGLKKELFGYVAAPEGGGVGGYARVLDRSTEVLEERGVQLRTGTPVTSIRPAAGGAEGVVVSAAGGEQSFTGAVCTLSAPLAAKIAPDLDDDERSRLEGVSYMGIVCASLLLRRPLGGYYLTYLTEPDLPFTAVVEMTAFVDPAEVGGHTLVYLPRYAPPDHPLFDASDEEVRDLFEPALRRLYPDLSDDDVLAFRVSRVRQVFAVPTLGYSERIPPMVTSVPGLYLAGSAHLLNTTLNVDDTLGLVDDVLAAIDTGARPGGALAQAAKGAGR